MIASPPADAGHGMLGGPSLGISECRTCGFGHKPGLWAAPGAQHKPAMPYGARCRDGDVDAESPTYFPITSTCAGCVKAQSN